jgi:F-type H+-transporting ATPase subunit alpha
LAQYREMEAFAKFGSELDPATQAQLSRGERMVEILKQDQYVPLPVERQIVIIYAGVNGYIDDIPMALCQAFETEFYPFLEEKHPGVLSGIVEKAEITEEIEGELMKAIEAFGQEFRKNHGLVEEEEVAEQELIAEKADS